MGNMAPIGLFFFLFFLHCQCRKYSYLLIVDQYSVSGCPPSSVPSYKYVSDLSWNKHIMYIQEKAMLLLLRYLIVIVINCYPCY